MNDCISAAFWWREEQFRGIIAGNEWDGVAESQSHSFPCLWTCHLDFLTLLLAQRGWQVLLVLVATWRKVVVASNSVHQFNTVTVVGFQQILDFTNLLVQESGPAPLISREGFTDVDKVYTNCQYTGTNIRLSFIFLALPISASIIVLVQLC